MPSYVFIWSDTNIEHLTEHDVTPEEASHVVQTPSGQEVNRNGDPVAFGYTKQRRHLAVAYWFVDEARTTVYVETAYDTPPRMSRNRR